MYEFQWDPAKAASNLRKHKVDFKLVATVFADQLARSNPDEHANTTEERWITMGLAENGQLLVVCHTFVDSGTIPCVRIISVRSATRNERSHYELGQ